jgi:hypothetical protein
MIQEVRYCTDDEIERLERAGWTISRDALASTHHSAYSKHLAHRDIADDEVVIYPELQGALE